MMTRSGWMMGTLHQMPMAPPPALSSSRWRRFALSAAFVCATIFLLAPPPPRPPPELPLDAPACRWVPKIEVCSHQLRGSSAPEGSLDAMTALWRAGVTCFEIDVTLLEGDGAALLTHPVRLAAATRGTSPSTLTEARAAGADPVSFPAAEDAVRRFAELLATWDPPRERTTQIHGEDATRATLGGPTLCLDLKGAAMSPAVARRLVDVAASSGVEPRVLVYVYGARVGEFGADVLASLRRDVPRVQIGLGRRDVDPSHADPARAFAPDQLRGVTALVPSAAFDLAWYEAAARTGLRIVSWTVNGRAAIVEAARRRVSAFITDEPIESRETLRDVRRACEKGILPPSDSVFGSGGGG